MAGGTPSAAGLFRKGVTFVKSALDPVHFPSDGLIEIAFSGRSNVGKSSLINALSGTKQLARASKTPGRTRTINFFNVGGNFLLTDLPGYGFATGPARDRYRWGESIETYLAKRDKRILKMVYVLLDSRRGIMEIDLQWFSFLQESRVPYKMVFTKADKVSSLAANACIDAGKQQWHILKGRSPGELDVISVSSTKKKGLDDMRRSMLDDLN